MRIRIQQLKLMRIRIQHLKLMRIRMRFRIHNLGETTNTAQLKSRYFRHQEGLTRHRRKLHSDQKSFRCSQCAAAFAFNYDLTRHIRRAHHRPPPPPIETAGDQQLVEEGEVVYLCQPPVETAAVIVGGRTIWKFRCFFHFQCFGFVLVFLPDL
jgi:hypothetical protein